MKRIFAFSLVLLLVMGFSGSALAMVLPTPEPEPDPEELILPSPSYSFNMAGEIRENYMSDGTYTADARIYSTSAPGNALNDYLSKCEEAGFEWAYTDTDFPGYNAYRISGGGYRAYLVINYGNKTLLLTEKGLPVQPEQKGPEPFELNKLLLTVNGNTYQMDFVPRHDLVISLGRYRIKDRTSYHSSYLTHDNDQSMNDIPFLFTSESSDYRLVAFSLPYKAETLKTYSITQNENANFLAFVLFSDDSRGVIGTEITSTPIVSLWRASRLPEIGLTSAQDNYQVKLTYYNPENKNNKKEYQGSFEGTFNDGKTVVTGTFWVEK